VKLRDTEFRDRSRGRTLTEAVQTDRVIHGVARDLLRELREGSSSRIRLIGVALTNLQESAERDQHTMLDIVPPIERPRDRALSAAVDRIRSRHGRVIGPGGITGTGRHGRDE